MGSSPSVEVSSGRSARSAALASGLPATSSSRTVRSIVWAALALLWLNFQLTFANQVSTPFIETRALLSIELILGLGALALLRMQRGPLRRLALVALGSAFTAVVLMRYVDVTAPGVMGRSFDLQADLPHVGNVTSMFLDQASLTVVLLLLFTVGASMTFLVATNALAIRAVDSSFTLRALPKSALVACAFLGLVLPFTLSTNTSTANSDPRPGWQRQDFDPWQGKVAPGVERGGERFLFAEPTALIAARWLATLRRPGELRLGSQVRSEFAGLIDPTSGRHADVIVIFLESYGVTLIEDPQHRPYIEDRYFELSERLAAGGVAYRSIQALSPTFAGGSWRAHASLLSGIRIENQRYYERLLASDHRSLPHLLAGLGYRTVAAEPGIREAWPEADYWNLDQIYDAAGLDYPGPDIGWWKIPDQFTLWRIWNDELAPPANAQPKNREPVFAKISLIMSHIPYKPIPAFVEDWQAVGNGTGYPEALHSVAADDFRDMTELSIRYVAAFRHELDILEAFLLDLAPENSLVIVAGDHQPPTLATHQSQSWAVPLHVFSRRPELVEAFADYGFEHTLLPEPTVHSRFEQGVGFALEDVLPVMAKAFESPVAGSVR